MESQGKRLSTNKEYSFVMSYLTDDGKEGDEPGWDVVNLLAESSKPHIIGCSVKDSVISLQIEYLTTGIMTENEICLYPQVRSHIETLIVKNVNGLYKIQGLKIYAPYTALSTLYALDGKKANEHYTKCE